MQSLRYADSTWRSRFNVYNANFTSFVVRMEVQSVDILYEYENKSTLRFMPRSVGKTEVDIRIHFGSCAPSEWMEARSGGRRKSKRTEQMTGSEASRLQ